MHTPTALDKSLTLDLSAAPQQRPRLNLKPRSVPKEEDGGGAGGGGEGGGGAGAGGGGRAGGSGNVSPVPQSSGGRASSIFGAAKPVDTASKEREVEERLKKQEERMQRQLDEDKGRGPERKMRDRSGVQKWFKTDEF